MTDGMLLREFLSEPDLASYRWPGQGAQGAAAACAGAGLLHTPLDTDHLYAGEGYRQFTTNWSLRDVEPAAPIRLVNFREEITADD